MTRPAPRPHHRRWRTGLLLPLIALLVSAASPARAADEPDLIFRRSTVFKWLSPNDKLATYGIDDPEVEGVACHFTVPERGGIKGWLGIAEEVSDISLACRQIGPIHFKDKMGQGDDMFRQRRSLFFKKMQIVRGCDAKRNVLVYMVYSDKLIEGSPKNSTSSVPIMPWGASRYHGPEMRRLRPIRKLPPFKTKGPSGVAVAYFCLGPTRGIHFRAQTTPVAVILVPDTSLIWPAGQVPSSTLTRCPSRKLTISCSRPTVACACVAATSNPKVARKHRAFRAAWMPELSVANETSGSVIWDFPLQVKFWREVY